MRALWSRLASLFRARRLEGELNDEVACHLAMLEDEFVQAGMEPRAAKLAARREFGGVTQAQEAYRDLRGFAWLEIASKNVRYAVRGLRRNPGFTAAAVFSLALGIGANTAIFSLFHAVMLRTLPVARPGELLSLFRIGAWGRGVTSYPLYLDVRKRTDLFQGVIASGGVQRVSFSSGAASRPETAQRELVSGNYFSALGVPPVLGRVFSDEDNRLPRAHPLAVLSHRFWQSRFGADPRVLGRVILVDEEPLTVVGVAAPGFAGVAAESRADLWAPVMMARVPIESHNMHWISIVARRRPEVPLKQIQAAVDVLMQRYLQTVYGGHRNAAFRKEAMSQRLELRDASGGLSGLRDRFGRPLTVLMAAAGLVLLAACLNLANLLLARAAARRKETALRISLGATRARLVGQAVTESVLLAVAGGILGVLLACWGVPYLLHFLPEAAGRPVEAPTDPAILSFALGISALSAVLFGLIPAWHSSLADPAQGLRSAMGEGSSRPVLRRVLATAQVAFSVVLVAMAGLFGRSLAELRSVDLGFRNQNVIAFTPQFPRAWKAADGHAARERIVARVELLPGVSSVSYGFPGPFQMGTSNASIRVPGSPRTAAAPVWVATQNVAPRYFETVGSPLSVGREFLRTDTADSRKVAVVNDAFVREFLPGERHPEGRVLSFDDSKPEGGEATFIVGVAPDILHQGLREGSEPTVYYPMTQAGDLDWQPTILVRGQLPAPVLIQAIRRELASVVPQIAMEEPRTIRQYVDESIFQERMLAALSGFFGGLSLLLAAVGLYGVVAYGTARRAGEIGIRIALGAPCWGVLWMVLRDALGVVALGLAIGLPFSFAAARTVSAVLFGIKPADPLSFAGTAAVLLTIGLAAAFLPARRAARLDPVRVLRQE